MRVGLGYVRSRVEGICRWMSVVVVVVVGGEGDGGGGIFIGILWKEMLVGPGGEA